MMKIPSKMYKRGFSWKISGDPALAGDRPLGNMVAKDGMFIFLPPAGHHFYEGKCKSAVSEIMKDIGELISELNELQVHRPAEPGVWYSLLHELDDDPEMPYDAPLEVKGAYGDDSEKIDQVRFSSEVGDWIGCCGDPSHWRIPVSEK